MGMTNTLETQKLNITIHTQVNNPLLPRKELNCDVQSKQTPSKTSLTSEISNLLGVQKEMIGLGSLKSKFGSDKTSFLCKLYKTISQMEKVEPFPVISKIFGVESKKLGKKMRKAERKKKQKVWGTERRNVLRAERKRLEVVKDCFIFLYIEMQ